MTPTARSLKYLREQGYVCDIAERYNAFTRKRNDLFGFIDIVAVHPLKQGLLGVQTTSTGNIQARIKKATILDTYDLWLNAGNKIEFHGWSKRGARGKRKLWTIKIIDGQTLDK